MNRMFLVLTIIFSITTVLSRAQESSESLRVTAVKDLIFLVKNSVHLRGRFYRERSGEREYTDKISYHATATAFQINERDVLTVEHALLRAEDMAARALAQSERNWAIHGIHVGAWPEEITSVSFTFSLVALDGITYEHRESYSATWEGDKPTKENIRKFIRSLKANDASNVAQDLRIVASDDERDIALIRLRKPRVLEHYVTLPSPFTRVDMDATYWGITAQTREKCEPFCFQTREGTIVDIRPSIYNMNDGEWKEAKSVHMKMYGFYGDSGGPVVNDQLELLGITNAGDGLQMILASIGCIGVQPSDRMILSSDEVNEFLNEQHR